MARTTIRTEDITASAVTSAKIAAGAVDTSGLEDDIALLGFRVASNGSLAKYNLVDQTVDDFQDTSGVDASASTNDIRDSSGKYYSGSISGVATGGTETTYTGYKVHSFTSTGNTDFVVPGSANVDLLLVAGGGGGGSANILEAVSGWGGGGGGGAGGFRTDSPYIQLGGSSIFGAGGGGGAGQAANGYGGAGGAWGSYTAGGGGTGATSGTAGDGISREYGCGNGGGGGGSNGPAGGFAGGNGGVPGGGGGGGHSNNVSNLDNSGGNGGNGEVRIWAW